MARRMATNFVHSLWLAALVLGLATGCGEGKRRYFAACGSNEECESDNCYTGHCTTSCTTSADCGTGICVEKHCLPTGAACDDGDPCTVGDVVAINICKSGGPKDCGTGNECQDFYCLEGHGCDAKAKNVGKSCDGSAAKVCADGSLVTGGCRCAAWQGNPIGPYDTVSVSGGATTSLPKGIVQIRGVAPLAGKVVLVGVAKAAASDPQWSAWLAVVNTASQNLMTQVVPNTNSQWNGIDTEALLAVGQAGGKAALLPLGESLAKLSLQGNGVLQPVPQDSMLRATATTLQGALAVGDLAGSSGLLVHMPRTGNDLVPASIAWSSVQYPQTTGCSLYGVAAVASGYLVVGSCGSQAWVANVADSSSPLAIANSQLLVISGASAASLTGLASKPSGELLAWGSAKTATSSQTGLAVGLDATGAVAWSQLIGPGDKQPSDLVWFTGGASWLDGKWLLVGGRSGSTMAPWTLTTDGSTLAKQLFGDKATALGTAASGNNAVYIGGSQGDRPWLQRFGPAGETDCP